MPTPTLSAPRTAAANFPITAPAGLAGTDQPTGVPVHSGRPSPDRVSPPSIFPAARGSETGVLARQAITPAHGRPMQAKGNATGVTSTNQTPDGGGNLDLHPLECFPRLSTVTNERRSHGNGNDAA